MGTTYLFAVLFVLAILGIASWIYTGRRLTVADVERIAEWRYCALVRAKYPFNGTPVAADLQFKASMEADGAYHSVEIGIESLLSTVASHLKHKKHEWVVFAFCRHGRITTLWCNKGPDRTTVSSTLPIQELTAVAVSLGCTALIRAHNHPNPLGGRLSLLGPSDQDLRSAASVGGYVAQSHMDFIDVVCERGHWLVFASALSNESAVRRDLRSSVTSLNAGTRAARRAARAKSSRRYAAWSSRSAHH